MKKDNRDLSQVYDLFAIRVIVDDVKDCYGVLGDCPRKVAPDSGSFQGLYCGPQIKWLSVPSYDRRFLERAAA